MLKLYPYIFLIVICLSCSHSQKESNGITIIKQWHLSPTTITTNIENSRMLPQYLNQKDIYTYLVNRINQDKELFLLVEGCEGGIEIDHNFKIPYNGWNFAKLASETKNPQYEDILTLLPLKMKVKYSKEVTAICADDEVSMKETQMALSDARGFLGFYLRLKENAKDPKKFSQYKSALEEAQKEKIGDPVAYSKNEALKALDRFNKLLEKRNQTFLSYINQYYSKNPVLILGGLHAKGLSEDLKNSNRTVTIFTPQGYPVSSETLPDDLMRAFNAK